MQSTPRTLTILLLALGFLTARAAWAADPPHDASLDPTCFTLCHIPHHAAGAAITTVSGNSNLCLNCHTGGGLAATKPFASTDPAIPGTSGTSHRWDSGASGWAKPNPANTSTGTLQSAGAYTGPYAKIYTITITTAGDVGSARFSWTATTPGGGSGSNLLTGASVALDQGTAAVFRDGTSSSFTLNDTWSIYVRADINQPTTAAMRARIDPPGDPANGKLLCSTCHDQHSQKKTPFDPAAPAYPTPGPGGYGRHNQRIDDDINQMCVDCHSVRNVASGSQGSHPVGVIIPVSGPYKMP